MAQETEPPPSLLHPLRHHCFMLIASATLVSNIGVWMRDTTNAWTVAGEARHHAAVTLVQAATSIPTFLLALPAGVLADHFDRRRILILTQLVLALCGGLLAWLSYEQLLHVETILIIALVAGSAAAIAAPAFQAFVPSLVPRAELPSAVAVSSISFNIARVVGPAAGGILLAASGAASSYAVNAAGYILVVCALLAVKPTPWSVEPPKGPIAFRDELHQGFAFVAASSLFRRILARGMALYVSASCYLSLTPLIAHDILGHDPGVYGTLLAATGIGSIVGGVVLSAVHKRRIADDTLLTACSVAAAVALVILALAQSVAPACLALALAGGSTLIQLATLNAAAQLLLPEAIRGRGLAIYMAATFGSMAVGSLLFGAVSDTFSIRTALLLGAAFFAGAALLGRAAHAQT